MLHWAAGWPSLVQKFRYFWMLKAVRLNWFLPFRSELQDVRRRTSKPLLCCWLPLKPFAQFRFISQISLKERGRELNTKAVCWVKGSQLQKNQQQMRLRRWWWFDCFLWLVPGVGAHLLLDIGNRYLDHFLKMARALLIELPRLCCRVRVSSSKSS